MREARPTWSLPSAPIGRSPPRRRASRWLGGITTSEGQVLTFSGHGLVRQNHTFRTRRLLPIFPGRGGHLSPPARPLSKQKPQLHALGPRNCPHGSASCVCLAAWVICLTPRQDLIAPGMGPLEASHGTASNPWKGTRSYPRLQPCWPQALPQTPQTCSRCRGCRVTAPAPPSGRGLIPSLHLAACLTSLRCLLKCHLLKEALLGPVTLLLPACFSFSRTILT